MLAGPHSLDSQPRTTSLLSVSSLTSIDLQKLQLAVLSACSTATGNEDEPRDPENLVRIFLRAGVPMWWRAGGRGFGHNSEIHAQLL